MNSNERKTMLLGMNSGTAQHRLRKMIMFMLVQETGRDYCYQCKKQIKTIEELSIEHIQSWQLADSPRETFFDLDNIAFSHLICNVTAASKHRPKIIKCGEDGATRYRDGCRCKKCKDAQAKKMRKYRRGKTIG